MNGTVPELRVPQFSYESLPEDWLADNPLASCLGNALHMVFPAGERFFVRSVMHYADRLRQNPELWRRVRGFAGQEGQHGYQHERVFEHLREQGVPVDAFLRIYEGWAYDFLAKTIASPRVHLASTVAAEHLTATLARLALESGVLDTMSREMSDLLRWHALEELEHQHVAWDVLQEVDDSYPLRLLGAVLICSVLFPFWFGGGLVFAAQRKGGLLETIRRSVAARRASGSMRPVLPLGALARALADYGRPGYRPGKPQDDALVAAGKAWFAELQGGSESAGRTASAAA